MAELVLRKLGEAVHKQPNSLHLFICPKLMMSVWGNMLFKMAELVAYVPPGDNFSPFSMHKSFFLGFIFPLIPHRTWWIRGTLKVIIMVRTVYLLLWESPWDAGSFLDQLRLLPKRVASMSVVLARVFLIR